jgi:four helix bundle protein
MSRLSDDIRERTMTFVSAIACLRMSLPNSHQDVERLGDRLLQAGTSVATHVREASLSRSDAEMCSRLEGAIQQADESMLCLEMLQDDCAINQSSLAHLRKEADAIVAAFTSIVSRIGGRSL